MRPAFLVCQAVACTCATQIDGGGARSRTAVKLAIQGGKLVHEQSIFRTAGLCTCMPHAARWQLERERVCQVCVCVWYLLLWYATLGSSHLALPLGHGTCDPEVPFDGFPSSLS